MLGVSVGALAVGCGDDSRDPPGTTTTAGTTCEQLTALACQRACACNEGQTSGNPDDCGWSYVDGATSFNSSRSANACTLGATRDVCGDTTKTEAFFEECLAAMESAPDQCEMPETPSDPFTFVLPPACYTLFDCNAGPCLN